MAKSKEPSLSRKPESHRQGFMTSLTSIFLEWLLMLLLFGHAVFSYVIMKFALYCNLPHPCLLCSRLDNVTGKKKAEYFQDLFCKSHKSEISSLVLCHAHCKLVDVHKMCETCLFSFATINKSNSEKTYRLLVGKLGNDSEGEFEQGSLIEGKKHVNKMRPCCCCNKLWCPKSYPRELLRTCSVDQEASQANLISIDDLPPKDPCETVAEDVKDSGPKVTLEEVTNLQSSKSLDIGDAYNIAISNKGRQISSGSFGERTVNNSTKISEDLKQLLSQISRGTDLPAFDMSPRVSRNLHKSKHLDPNSSEIQMLQTRSGLESVDESVSEFEGETLLDRLKHQFEHNKKLLLNVYKELEEERNASTIAANQAMAMITRLQEEKAALHMDASQYLRMMEEQAEYDMEALRNCNDLLSEKEIEIQGLEAELEYYRSKYPDEGAFLEKSQSC